VTNTAYIFDEAYNEQKREVMSPQFRYAALLGTPVLVHKYAKLTQGTEPKGTLKMVVFEPRVT
jgi:hypothetical protein